MSTALLGGVFRNSGVGGLEIEIRRDDLRLRLDVSLRPSLGLRPSLSFRRGLSFSGGLGLSGVQRLLGLAGLGQRLCGAREQRRLGRLTAEGIDRLVRRNVIALEEVGPLDLTVARRGGRGRVRRIRVAAIRREGHLLGLDLIDHGAVIYRHLACDIGRNEGRFAEPDGQICGQIRGRRFDHLPIIDPRLVGRHRQQRIGLLRRLRPVLVPTEPGTLAQKVKGALVRAGRRRTILGRADILGRIELKVRRPVLRVICGLWGEDLCRRAGPGPKLAGRDRVLVFVRAPAGRRQRRREPAWRNRVLVLPAVAVARADLRSLRVEWIVIGTAQGPPALGQGLGRRLGPGLELRKIALDPRIRTPGPGPASGQRLRLGGIFRVAKAEEDPRGCLDCVLRHAQPLRRLGHHLLDALVVEHKGGARQLRRFFGDPLHETQNLLDDHHGIVEPLRRDRHLSETQVETLGPFRHGSPSDAMWSCQLATRNVNDLEISVKARPVRQDLTATALRRRIPR